MVDSIEMPLSACMIFDCFSCLWHFVAIGGDYMYMMMILTHSISIYVETTILGLHKY